MNSQTRKRLVNFIDSVESGKLPMTAQPYSLSLESKIQQAVNYKRNGDYDKSVSLYLDLLDTSDIASAEIMSFLYKVVLCAEEFFLAYRIICLSEQALIRERGPKGPVRLFPGGPVMFYMKWEPTQYKEDLVSACREAKITGNLTSLRNLVKSFSGNENYSFKKSLSEILNDIENI